MDDDVEIRERVFHNAVREYIVSSRKTLFFDREANRSLRLRC